MIVDLVTIAVCATAGSLFARGLYHSGVLTGWIVQGLTPPPAARQPDPAPKWDAEAHEMQLFLDTGMWWLDPNRWGDDPDWRDRIPAAIQPVPAATPAPYPVPKCPNCGRTTLAEIKVTAEHGGVPSMWECERCGCEYTKKGETRASKQRGKRIDEMRNVAAQMRDLDRGLLSPQELRVPYMPGSVYDDLPESPYPYLPCGCSGFGQVHHASGPGWSYTRCQTCRKWWEPPSNGRYRTLAQSCYVQEKDDMTPDVQAIWARRPANEGVCPNYECQHPVAKRHGMYYCTNKTCRNHTKEWR